MKIQMQQTEFLLTGIKGQYYYVAHVMHVS